MGQVSPAVAEAIRMAIELEKDGEKFFREAANKTENKLGKKMFQSLAEDELKHLETFQHMFDTMTGTDAWRSIAEEIGRLGKVPVFEEVSKKSPVKDSTSEVEGLRLAMEIEKKAIEFFSEAIEQADDPVAVEIFERIRGQEEYHYGLIQAQYDYVAKTGFWFDVAEFRMDGKF